MRHAIYPPIGIARLGDSPDRFFIGPEIPGRGGVEIDSAGNEQAVTEYKHSSNGQLLIKRQAARFRIFEIADEGSPPQPLALPAGAKIEWTVHLVNKKAAVTRGNAPSTTPRRPRLVANPQQLLIDPGSRSITGANASGIRFDGGRYQGREVPLGDLQTDSAQNLLVMGGHGFSSSPTNAPIRNFYNSPGWHDDTSDGPIHARVLDAKGAVLIDGIEPAWVVVAPPDFAPEVGGFVTLYDILHQVGLEHFGIVFPAQTSFVRDIFPIIRRIQRLKWVNNAEVWSKISEDYAALANSSASAQAGRQAAKQGIEDAVTFLSDFSLTNAQDSHIQRWVDGNFVSDWSGIPQPSSQITAEGLTRAALDGTVGQGFFPGIEAGIIVKDQTLYSSPFDFRIDQSSVNAGDLTSLMALPWQADFLACARNWWPAQRPDDIRQDPSSSDTESWDRGIDSFAEMVQKFARLGFVTPATDSQGNTVYVETQRAPDSVFI